MKIFILTVCALLPCLISGLPTTSTEKWDKDDPFVLGATSAQEGQESTNLVKVPLSKSDSPRIIKQDEIFPMILQQLLEESLKNEVKGASKKINEPLTYMTPPSTPLETNKEKENDWIDEADSVTTTTDSSASGMGEGQSVSSGTEGSQESSEASPTTRSALSDFQLLKQYAEKYPLYIPVHHDSEDLEHQPSTNSFQSQEPESKMMSTSNNMDKADFTEESESKSEDNQQKPIVPEEPSDEPTTSAPIFLDQTTDYDYGLRPTTEQSANSVPDEVPDTKTDNRPIYYIIFRPRNSGMETSPYSNKYNGGLMPQSPYSLNNFNYAPMRRSYRFPSFIAQDYEDQVPSTSQYYPTPMSSRYRYQQQPFYNGMSGYSNNYQQYPFMQMSSRYDSPYYNYNSRDLDTSASSYSPYTPPFYRMTRSPPSFYYPQNYNNYNSYQQPSYPNFGMRSFNNGYGSEGFQNPYYYS